MPCLLGIDSGLTVTKAVVFDEAGTPLALARRRVPQIISGPRHVERDMNELWRAAAEAIAEGGLRLRQTAHGHRRRRRHRPWRRALYARP